MTAQEEARAECLYFLDDFSNLRFSHENPAIVKLYKEYLEKPLSHKSHKLLHTDHFGWEMPLAPRETLNNLNIKR